jgi:hypothetical protein
MSAGGMKDARVIIVVFAATLVITLVTASIAPSDGPGATAPTSFSAAPAGGKAAYLTLRALGYDVERSFEPAAQLRGEPKRTVLIVTGALPPSDQDKRALQAFVASGGVAVVSGTNGASFVGIQAGGEAGSFISPPVATHHITEVDVKARPIARGVNEITISPLDHAIDPGADFIRLVSRTPEEPLLATAVRGAGRVVWLAAPTPFMNEHIRQADNLQFLLNVAGTPGERLVLWDEHYHGNTRSLWSYAVNTPLPWMGGQAGLILASAVFAFGRRRAPVRPRVEVPRTSSLEFIDMLSALYRRAKAAPAAVAAARGRLLRAITAVCGVSADRGDDVLARAVAARLGIDPQAVARTLSISGNAETVAGLEQKAATALAGELQTLTTQLYSLRRVRQPVAAGRQES